MLHRLCDRREDLTEEMRLLKDVFIENGYPQKSVDHLIKSSWKAEIERMLKKIQRGIKGPENKGYYDVLHAPYVKGFSEKLQKELKTLNVGFVMKKGKTIGSVLLHLKPKTRKEDVKDVVYKIECSTCKMKYIGETSQRMSKRRKQHESDVRRQIKTNGIYCYLKKNKDHIINWENQQALLFEKDWKLRKIKESIIIDALNPTTEMKMTMNLEKGMKIDPCWKAIAPEIRFESK